MRTRTLLALCVAVVLVATVGSVALAHTLGGHHPAGAAAPGDAGSASATGPSASGSGPGRPVATGPAGAIGTGDPAARARIVNQQGPPPPTLIAPADPSTVTATGTKFFGWALLNRHTGAFTGSTNRETVASTTESMIKVWIISDYLRHQKTTPAKATLGELTTMIVNSDDNLAYKYYELNGGDSSIKELIPVCGLRNTHPPSLRDRWSYTTMSPADAVRLGACIADGRAAGPKWTSFVLSAMRHVTGTVDQQKATSGGGRWGIIDGLPANLVPDTAIKNGWTAQVYDHNWHVNCLAVHTDWVLAIEIHYPWTSPDGDWQHATNLRQGAQICASVTRQLVGYPAW